METAITISVNGEDRTAKPGASVSDLLRELGLDGGIQDRVRKIARRFTRCFEPRTVVGGALCL